MQNELCMCPWTWNISFNDLVNFADIFYLSAAFLFLLSHCDLLEILARLSLTRQAVVCSS